MSSQHEHEPLAPPATPAYRRIAVALGRDIRDGRIEPGSRLPAERALARRFGVNRQTVRVALQLLREQGFVTTEKRGSFTRAPAAAAPLVEPSYFPGGADSLLGPRTEARLNAVSVAPEMAAVLGLAPGETTLVHHHRTFDADGESVQDAITHFTRTAITEVPELRRYHRRPPGRQPELRLRYEWMDRAGLAPRVRESITVTRPDTAPSQERHPRLSVRRQVHDARGRLLEVTDLCFSPRWEEVAFEFSGRSLPLGKTVVVTRP
ncbi:GntR family transcriptional regulator [Streptomyces sp. NPDC006283]|uniref:GntR family transcriptional regulator n=1 Tax=Streptomyces sp. NPDC006283 TaxID=3156741 RepID=UPI0033B07B7A